MGSTAFCVYSRSWQDYYHIVYDLAAGVAVFSFIAQIVVEGIDDRPGPLWWLRAALLVPVSLIPAARVFLHWPISGHVTDVLLVAGLQAVDRRLKVWLRGLYWVPVAIAVWLRWFHFDRGGHRETSLAAMVAAGCLGLAALVYGILASRFKKSPPLEAPTC